ncbi:MAG: Yip1 family protein [bacterium]|nr:Yip1 family protein [bacterium]
MAKFCSQCGRKLEDGEVCNCSTQPVQGQPVQGQPVQGQPVQGQPVQGQPVQNQFVQGQFVQGQFVNQQMNAGQASIDVKGVVADMGDMLKQPVTKTAEFAKEKKGMAYGAVFAGINVFISTCIAIFSMIYLHAKVGDYAAYLPDIPYVQFPIMILVFTAAGIALMTTCLFLFDNKVFHGDATFGSMLTVVGAKALLSTAFLILGAILGIISPVVGISVIVMGIVVSLGYMVVTYTQVSVLDANKKAFVAMIAIAIMTVINLLFVRIVMSVVMSSLSSYISSLLNIF